VKMKWLGQERINPRAAELYFSSQQTLFLYATAVTEYKLDADPKGFNEASSDPFSKSDLDAYVFWMNLTYPHDKISVSKIKDKALINFLDPFSYFSLYSWWYYVFTGRTMPIPMFKIGQVSYLPGVRMALAPYGFEYYVENFFVYKSQPYYFYVKWGDHGGVSYRGIGFEGEKLGSWNWGSLGCKIDIWHQPKFFLSTKIFDALAFPELAVAPSRSKEYGAAVSLITRWNLGKKKLISLYVEGGYKSQGYLPGYSLDKGVVARLGLSGNF